ncbi:acyl-CoA dehydrogenase [Methylobrevis albus]|uniref:3-methylmercaptopropionyl-CoA dehydrogenase n=1 Tax=Methylobrevis albus TaxID=2793297 RepID=A0A931I0J0_9HYPH|nr:acyl-CoA dehydrogenase [Methylobrevis albus]MBH0237110.1 acyl-CoA dehydrogenase [Methylobrevis albus]
MQFRAPVESIADMLNRVAGLDRALERGHFPDLSADVVSAILAEAGRFATERLAPLNQPGDRAGARLDNGTVTTAPGFAAAYADWTAGGWNGLAAPTEHGGQGLPLMLNMAVYDMWNAACPAFAICPVLTGGAIEALERHASPELKARYLLPLVEGRWTGTMNLTEPQAGSDLGALRTRAERRDDGSYRLFGQKIYITYGDHDMAENIVHLVLARLPDAPAGTRGISLFLAPKFLPDEAGRPTVRNDIAVAGLEHKLGIHASPTCTMVFGDAGGATAWLVGAENRGLAAMFTMMNNARLAVAIQGVGVAERATQRAAAYAAERRQGRAPDAAPGAGMSPIAEHPDVKRMLLTMRGLTDASRAIAYALAFAIDMERAAPEAERPGWAVRAALLTPVAKAFATDAGFEVASIGVQVHGGMGYIEETGAAQHLRDARIFQIYEGTNGIQAIDLVTRKLTLAEGAAFRDYVAELRGIVADCRGHDAELDGIADLASTAIGDLTFAASWLTRALAEERTAEALTGASDFLALFGTVAGAIYLLQSAAGGSETRRVVARVFAATRLPHAAALRLAVTHGARTIADADAVLAAAG